ncbi:transmembrane protein, putative (macronuclear) [Tetrahymena thermophila SB210]|uniref:Transmembrane protein, putative n=1 Tax=Tetrahymena thermophila (strain SB210) TaxID=312017 RepID=W7XIZ9_TETTS|nr:transmembrane protein, putative [Tetrahymena thermophila SB210]EWS73749.1 transmembrane protein, putative [Tetrahymena thermophila SB210]|eukprot:XP_012653713.1 transmembrane protein, putative [Tetrahymena thermophila SB210]
MNLSKKNENFRSLQNQYIDTLQQIDKSIKQSVGNVNKDKLQKLKQDFTYAQNLLKEMDLECLSNSQNINQAKREIQMHQMDLKQQQAKYQEMLVLNQKHCPNQIQGLDQFINDIELQYGSEQNYESYNNFFAGNLKLIQAKQDVFFMDQLQNQMQKNIYEQNNKLDTLNQQQKVIESDIKQSSKLINILQAKRYLTKYFIYFILFLLAILFFYVIFDKIAYFFK